MPWTGMRGQGAGGGAQVELAGCTSCCFSARTATMAPIAKIRSTALSTFRIAHPIIAIAMPELPDVSVYVEALEKRLLGQPLQKVRLSSPFVLRTFDPAPSELHGKH